MFWGFRYWSTVSPIQSQIMPLWGRYWVPFIHDAEVKENGETIVSEGKGEPLLIEGKLTDTKVINIRCHHRSLAL